MVKVSMRVIVVLVTVVVAVAVALVSIIPLREVALELADMTIENIEHASVDAVRDRIRARFGPNVVVAEQVLYFAHQGYLDRATARSHLPFLQVLANTSGLGVSIIYDNGLRVSIEPIRNPHMMRSTFYYQEWISGVSIFSLEIDSANFTNILSGPNTTATTLDPRIGSQWLASLRAQKGWAPMFAETNADGESVRTIGCGGPLRDATGAEVGALFVHFNSQHISALEELEVGETGRALVFETSSGRYIGGNIGSQSHVQLPTFSELIDPLTQLAFSKFGNTPFTCAPPCSLYIGDGIEKIETDVKPLTDSYGLQLRMLVIIPFAEFLEDLDRETNTGIMIASIVTVVLIILSALATYAIMRPLDDVASRMSTGRVLDKAGEEDEQPQSESIFSEVSAIQVAYQSLREQLLQMRSFVSPALLKKLDSPEDDDDDNGSDFGGEEDEGSVSMTPGQTPREQALAESASVKKPTSSHALDSASKSSRATAHTRAKRDATDKMAVMTSQSVAYIASKPITVLVGNVRGFHSLSVVLSGPALISVHEKIMGAMVSAADKRKGILEYFSGDHFVFSFNASSRAMTHPTLAMDAALDANHAIAQLSFDGMLVNHATVSFGAATGTAKVGTMGTNEIKRFNIVGHVVNDAFAMERRAVSHSSSNCVAVISPQLRERALLQYLVESIDVVAKSDGSGSRGVIAALTGKKDTGTADEWMYELAAGEAGDPLKNLNDAYDHFVSGQADKATELCAKLDESLPAVARLKALLAARRGGGTGDGGGGGLPSLALPSLPGQPDGDH